jgi:hypothetical protein
MKYYNTIAMQRLFQIGNRYFFLTFLILFSFKTLSGQIIYGSFYDDVTNATYVVKVDLNTCTFCTVTPASTNIGAADIVILPDGSHLNFMGSFINRLLPPPSTQVVWQGVFPQVSLSGQLAPNGLVYLAGFQGLGIFDPATNTVTYIGDWPAGVSGVNDLYYVNGVLYGSGYDNNGIQFLLQINISTPAQSTILGTIPITTGAEGGTWNGNAGFFYGDAIGDIYFYNPLDNSSTLICDIQAFGAFGGLSFPPPGLPEYPCLTICTTNAGTLPTAGPYNTCTNSTLTFPAATGVVLDANDLLRYILFTNPSDTAGSIVATSSTPSFTFNAATMQTGITYYIAAMAGNNASGSINLNDPCLDFSNALQVIWRPLPAVSFSISGGNPNLCGGECRTVVASLTGTPPFTLTYTTPAGAFSQVFSGNSGSFQVCAPVGAAPGPLLVQATALVDGWCTCQ